jgi:hypothetical protein
MNYYSNVEYVYKRNGNTQKCRRYCLFVTIIADKIWFLILAFLSKWFKNWTCRKFTSSGCLWEKISKKYTVGFWKNIRMSIWSKSFNFKFKLVQKFKMKSLFKNFKAELRFNNDTIILLKLNIILKFLWSVNSDICCNFKIK